MSESLTMLYEVREALGWNDKTGLSLVPGGVRELRKSHAELLAALKALWHETVESGNSDAKDYGWPKARELTLNSLKNAEAL